MEGRHRIATGARPPPRRPPPTALLPRLLLRAPSRGVKGGSGEGGPRARGAGAAGGKGEGAGSRPRAAGEGAARAGRTVDRGARTPASPLSPKRPSLPRSLAPLPTSGGGRGEEEREEAPAAREEGGGGRREEGGRAGGRFCRGVPGRRRRWKGRARRLHRLAGPRPAGTVPSGAGHSGARGRGRAGPGRGRAEGRGGLAASGVGPRAGGGGDSILRGARSAAPLARPRPPPPGRTARPRRPGLPEEGASAGAGPGNTRERLRGRKRASDRAREGGSGRGAGPGSSRARKKREEGREADLRPGSSRARAPPAFEVDPSTRRRHPPHAAPLSPHGPRTRTSTGPVGGEESRRGPDDDPSRNLPRRREPALSEGGRRGAFGPRKEPGALPRRDPPVLTLKPCSVREQ